MFTLRLGLVCLALGLCWALPGVARANPAWHPIDADELRRVRLATPRAAELFDLAEAKLRAGELQAAEHALAEARTLDAGSWLLGRRHCQVLTELGRPLEARSACRMALVRSSAMDSRAMVGALMARPDLATPAELTQAVREAVAARRLREQPFSDAALCDIAHHIGDEAMLSSCVESLERVAPANFETARFRSVQKLAPAWALWLGWGALAAAVALTALHALWRWLRRPLPSKAPAASVVAACLLLAVAFQTHHARAEAPQAAAPQDGPSAPIEVAPAPAQPASPETPRWQLSTSFPIDHDNPEDRIPSVAQRNKDPLEFGYFLQDLNTEALKAERKGDYRGALKYWRAAAKAVPDAAVSFSKACRAYQILGERAQALEYCSRALNLQGSTQEDYLRWGELVTQGPQPLSALEIQDLDAAIQHLRKEAGQEGPAAVIECRLGVKVEDPARLKSCTAVLAKLSPNDPRTLTFQWSYALLEKDYASAQRLVQAMEHAAMPAAALAQVRSATREASAWWRRPLTDWRYGVGVLLGLGLLGLALFNLRRRLARIAPAGTAPAT